MKGSLERVRKVMSGQKPDRIPIFDLIANDAVLQYFNNGIPVDIGDDESGIRAVAAATDATRFSYFSPMQERSEAMPNGRMREYGRWTIWTSNREYSSSDEYSRTKRTEMSATGEGSTAEDPFYRQMRGAGEMFGTDYYYVLYAPCPGLSWLYEEVGLEAFSYYLSDCGDVIDEQLEASTEGACKWMARLPDDDPFDAIFIGEDIAFKSGPMFSPRWLSEHYWVRLKRFIDAAHHRQKKVVFHSDGNLNEVMDDLVSTGIDALNPIEVAAGMDLADLHKRYPKLVFAGGIDVSHVLPFGTPQEIKDAVVRAIEDTEGQILVGSSTEVMNNVPLENFLAMREAAIEYRL